MLLQTLHLSRITLKQFRSMTTPFPIDKMPTVDPDPLCSNIYSIPERIVLLWMNHMYEQQRRVVWKDYAKGKPP